MKTKTLDENQALLNEFYPLRHVRRSRRKTKTELEKARQAEVMRQIHTRANEKDLVVEDFKEKGRGVRTKIPFKRGDFVVEYIGELLPMREALIRERKYAQIEEVGSYMYFFKHNDVARCVDATEETEFKGRLINHSYLKPNMKTRVIEEANGPIRLCLFALRDIKAGEELLYDYGDHSAESFRNNPWLLTT